LKLLNNLKLILAVQAKNIAIAPTGKSAKPVKSQNQKYFALPEF